jgi:hypothetical protein
VLYEVGDVVHYLRTDSIYLLLEKTEVESVPSWTRGEGVGFRAFVLYSGRTYAKQGTNTIVWILNKSVYYEIISKGSQNAV